MGITSLVEYARVLHWRLRYILSELSIRKAGPRHKLLLMHKLGCKMQAAHILELGLIHGMLCGCRIHVRVLILV